ncbi:MAG: hypothetical protein WHV44_11350 [Anaerolineales bacterium]
MTDMTFRQWLKLQRWRDDPVGDIARDFLDDPCAKGLRTVGSIRRHVLYAHRPCTGAVEALDTAIGEYLTRDIFEVEREN